MIGDEVTEIKKYSFEQEVHGTTVRVELPDYKIKEISESEGKNFDQFLRDTNAKIVGTIYPDPFPKEAEDFTTHLLDVRTKNTGHMETRNIRKERIGVVTSNRMEKSIVVSEVKRVKHPMYGKFVLKTKKYVAHDEENSCNIGDTVKIMETRPISKSKCWRMVEIIERAK